MIEKAQKLVLDDEQENIEEIIDKKRSSRTDEGYFNTYSHFAIHHEMLTVCIYVLYNLYYSILYFI